MSRHLDMLQRAGLDCLVALLVSGCLTHVRHVEGLEIHAYDKSAADEVATAVEPALKVLCGVPGYEVPHEPLMLVRKGEAGRMRGTTRTGGIELWLDPSLQRMEWRTLRFLVAHELGHYYLGTQWQPLPAFMEEGLVDLLAMRIAPTDGVYRRSLHVLRILNSLGETVDIRPRASESSDGSSRESRRIYFATPAFPSPRAAAEIGRETLVSLPDIDAELLTAIGWVLADRVGTDQLWRFVERARRENLPMVPIDWITQAACMNDDPTTWREVSLLYLGAAECRELWKLGHPRGETAADG